MINKRKIPNRIKALIEAEGYTINDVAKFSGYTRGNIWHWIHGKIQNQKIEDAVCTVTGKSRDELEKLRKEKP